MHQRIAVLALVLTGSAAGQELAEPKWNEYRDTKAVHLTLKRWANARPEIARLHTIGKTLKGTPLLVLELTNQKTGPAHEKPAWYFDGNIHSEELTSAEVALCFGWTLVSGYGQDPRITKLLDTRVVYLRPKFNPDGADVALGSVHNPRSTPRPYDEDRDGRKDEDPPQDLDGDGFITTMRRKNSHGAWKASPADARLLVRRRPEDHNGTFYDVYSEGVDDDGDGKFNEDDVGGIDMNRNFPRNWGLEFEQRGAGPYPLSEPETRATVEFLYAHRNVCGLFCGHTSGGFLFRLPSTTSWDAFPVPDQRLILGLSASFTDMTGQPVRPSYADPRAHRHGTLISWGYWDYGVVGFVPEFWGGFGTDLDSDGDVTEVERLRFDADVNRKRGFAPWKPFRHPQLGEVEIGGWRRRFTTRNPPRHLLETEIRRYIPWMLHLAETTPRIVITEAEVTRLGTSDHYEVRARVRNVGSLATNVTQRALDSKVAVPVRAHIEMTGGALANGTNRLDLGHLPGQRSASRRHGPATSAREARWTIEKKAEKLSLTITVTSEKGGTVRRKIDVPR